MQNLSKEVNQILCTPVRRLLLTPFCRSTICAQEQRRLLNCVISSTSKSPKPLGLRLLRTLIEIDIEISLSGCKRAKTSLKSTERSSTNLPICAETTRSVWTILERNGVSNADNVNAEIGGRE